MSNITRILNAIEQGDGQATEEMLPLVNDELQKLATLFSWPIAMLSIKDGVTQSSSCCLWPFFCHGISKMPYVIASMGKMLTAVASVSLGLCLMFALPPAAAGQRIEVETSAGEVGKYEKLEFTVHVDHTYENAFDAAEVDLSLQIKTPSDQMLTLPVFWHQRYQRRQLGKGNRQDTWFYPLGKPVWTARFAPMEVGTHLAVVRRKDCRGTFDSPVVHFECKPSKRNGFLRTSTRDPRFFEFSEGQPFFAIGQNLAFIGNQQYTDLSKAEEIFGKLSRSGANFLRVWTCCEDWATAIEARKSVWGRSWHWKPPIVPMPEGDRHDPQRKCLELSGDDGSRLSVSPSHPVALLPGTRYLVAGKVRTDGKVGVRL